MCDDVRGRRRARAGFGGIIAIDIADVDIDINFNEGASTCISHAGADVTSPPRRFRKNLYHEIREAGRARASAEDLCPPQSRAAIGPFLDRRWTVAKSLRQQPPALGGGDSARKARPTRARNHGRRALRWHR